MKPSPKKVLERLNRVMEAWQSIRPNETFAGLTLTQFQEAVQNSIAARERLAEHLRQADAAIAQRNAADAVTMNLVRRVVSGVKAHELEGENGEMYRVLGYVLANERLSGLTRRAEPSQPTIALKAA